MSNLPGNPHVYAGPQIASPETIENDFIGEEGVTAETMILSELTRNTEATLALAYEQRTANLIAYVEKIDDQTLIAERCSEIAHRLGLKTSREMRAEK